MTTPEIRFVEVGVLVEPEPRVIHRPNVRLTNYARESTVYDPVPESEKTIARVLVDVAMPGIKDYRGGPLSLPSGLPEYVRKLGLRRTKGFMQELWDYVNQYILYNVPKPVEAVFRMIYLDLGRDLKTLRRLDFEQHWVGNLPPPAKDMKLPH